MAERWKAIAGFEGFYEVSDRGRVRSLPRWRSTANGGRRLWPGTVLKPLINTDGYFAVQLRDGITYHPRRVHRLVLEAFVRKARAKEHGRHLNGNYKDNRLVNLAWGTCKENMADKHRHGTMPLGSKHYKAVLTEAIVRKMRRGEYGTNQHGIARKLGVAVMTVNLAIRGKTWQHVK